MKLGEVLIEEGAISAAQLQEALDLQLSYGGHLGTCLIELGCLSEERLGQALARVFGVPCAPPASLQDIPPFVVNALPPNIVQKHSSIPMNLNDKILDVAMIDPKNHHALEELRLASGCAIRSWIAPEVRIVQAMERYYEIPRRIRYVTLCRALDKSRPPSSRSRGGDFDHFEGRTSAERHATTIALEPASPRVTLRTAAHVPADPLAAFSNRLCAATTEDEIADLVLDAMQGDVRRRILFKVQGDIAYVWRSSGAGIHSDTVANVRFPVLSEPIFGLLNGDGSYAGRLPSDPMNLGFYRKLGIDTPNQIVLLPVHTEDHLIAMFYGDCGRKGTIGLELDNHRRLLAKAALAIHVVQTKQKIHAI